ncbi:dsDNA nuclease domain-containing protein [Bradyrhizobium sp. UFLA05-112]
MSFADRLVAEPQREKSGETGAQRYDYQALWGLTLVFAHHGTSSDYAISFEFHDDIVLLNSSSAPSQASFYQVKTKSKGHWTLTELTSRKKRKNDPNNGLLPSHAGKLYSNYDIFPSETNKLAFVSNVPCQFFDAAATECCMSDAEPKMLSDLTAKLQAEYPTASATIVDELFRFVRADLKSSGQFSAYQGQTYRIRSRSTWASRVQS